MKKNSIKSEIITVLKRHKKVTNNKMKKSTSNRSRRPRLLINPLIALVVIIMITGILGCENEVATKRGVVSGLVLDTKGNRVVDAVLTSHRSLLSASTNEQGYYEFTSLDVGTHRLSIEKSGFYLASRTIELGYGTPLSGINIELEPLPNMVSWKLINRSVNKASLDITCTEPMSVVVTYRERYSMFIHTAPDAVAKEHIIELENLFENSEYLVTITGTTADGRIFTTEETSFRTVPKFDVSGAPDMPVEFKISQNTAGAEITWKYTGIDPLKGFRIFKAEGDSYSSLLIDEDQLFANDTKFIDEFISPGQKYSYSIQAIDLDGNVSSLTSKIDFIPAGEIKANIVWKKSWSPIAINGDIRVPEGKVLTIEAGTTVKFSETDLSQLGYDPTTCEFIIEGTIIAEGSSSDHIKLISSSALPSRTDWKGIRIIANKSQQESVLQYIDIAGAENGVAIYDSSINVGNISARYCQTGLSIHGASGTSIVNVNINDCITGFMSENSWDCSLRTAVIRDVTDGIIQQGDTNFSLRDFDIRNIAATGLQISARTAPYVRSGVIRSNATGLIIGAATGDFQFLTIDAVNAIIVDGANEPVLKNCILVNTIKPTTGIGIFEKTLGRSYTYTNIYNFETATENCDQIGSPILNVDPKFLGGTGVDYDYHLMSDSPITTMADNKSEPGAYGAAGL